MKELNTLKNPIFTQWNCDFTFEAENKRPLQKLPYVELQYKKQILKLKMPAWILSDKQYISFVFCTAVTETLTCNTLTIIIHFLNQIKLDIRSKVNLSCRIKSDLEQS